jgi:hypothetical protein
MDKNLSRQKKLTKRIVDAAKPRDGRYVMWDSVISGFGLSVAPTNIKCFILRYRPRRGGRSAPKRFMTIGRFGVVTAEKARQRAIELLGEVAKGNDPAASIRTERESITVADAARDFLSTHVATKRKPNTVSLYRRADVGAGGGIDREVDPRIPVRKPSGREYFMVNPDPNMSLTTTVVFDREQMRNDVYLVTPAMRELLAGDMRPALLVPAITRQDALMIWPLPLPIEGRPNDWHERARLAMERGKVRWTRMAPDMVLGTYRLYEPLVDHPHPVWPQKSLKQLLEVAFAGKVIDTEDHPLVRRLQGRT